VQRFAAASALLCAWGVAEGCTCPCARWRNRKAAACKPELSTREGGACLPLQVTNTTATNTTATATEATTTTTTTAAAAAATGTTTQQLMIWQLLNLGRLIFCMLAWALVCYRFSMALVARMYAARKLSVVQEVVPGEARAPSKWAASWS
jgi:hypothetical protein